MNTNATLLAQVRDVASLRRAIAQGEAPNYLFFWGHRPSRDGSITKSCFSQWFESSFAVDGQAYATAEHFMMAGKARAFGDTATLERVHSARTPAEAKALGRQVAGFDDARWNAVRFEIVVQANAAKFSQNDTLREFLLRTGEQVLVEASPVDRVWGIGLAADSPACHDPAQWQGENLLGFALMEVRQRLRERP